MDLNINQILFALLRSAICGTKLTENEPKFFWMIFSEIC